MPKNKPREEKKPIGERISALLASKLLNIKPNISERELLLEKLASLSTKELAKRLA